ncbi:MAG: hypothetical protein KA402_08880 [Bacteroides sp.]|nr:hypothetical protein [Bacteroides sp.]
MSSKFKAILLLALFAVLFLAAGDQISKASSCHDRVSSMEVHPNYDQEDTSAHLSVASDLQNSSHSTYETSAAAGDWNVSKGILSQNNTFIGISFQKFYKSALTILAIRQLDTLLTQRKSTLLNTNNKFIRQGGNYYIYTLRHILI